MDTNILARGLQQTHARPRNARHGQFDPPIARTILIILFIASVVANAALVRSLIIFADSGDVGIKAAFAAADRYEAHQYAVEVITPAADYESLGADDFNSILQATL